MNIQYKKLGDLLKVCMAKKYSAFTMEQAGLIARGNKNGNRAIDKMMEFCQESKTEKEFLTKAQTLLKDNSHKRVIVWEID